MLHVVFPILDLCFNPYGEKKYCFSQSIDYKRTRLAFFSSVFFTQSCTCSICANVSANSYNKVYI